MKRIRILNLLLPILILVFSNQGWAHKVNVFATAEGEMVAVQGYFPDGRPTENAVVEVYDESGNKIFEGKTDSEGLWSFKPEKSEPLRIVLNASLGHRNEYLLPVEELPESLSKGGSNLATGQAKAITTSPPPASSDEARKKHRPPSPGKEPAPWLGIIAGLGFIFGLAGLLISLSVSRQLKENCHHLSRHDDKERL